MFLHIIESSKLIGVPGLRSTCQRQALFQQVGPERSDVRRQAVAPCHRSFSVLFDTIDMRPGRAVPFASFARRRSSERRFCRLGLRSRADGQRGVDAV